MPSRSAVLARASSVFFQVDAVHVRDVMSRIGSAGAFLGSLISPWRLLLSPGSPGMDSRDFSTAWRILRSFFTKVEFGASGRWVIMVIISSVCVVASLVGI